MELEVNFLQGTVRNVAPFGVFIDIGLKNDGLAHISKLASHYVKDLRKNPTACSYAFSLNILDFLSSSLESS